MINELLKSKIAFVGGGRFCKNLLELLYSDLFEDQRPSILGVADKDEKAEGLVYAGQMGIFTTSDFRALFELEHLDVIMELTSDERLRVILNLSKPSNISNILKGSLLIHKHFTRCINRLRSFVSNE